MNLMFGNTAHILALSSHSPPGLAGGAPDGYGLGRGAAGPGGGTSMPHGATPSRYPGRDHPYVPPPVPNRDRGDWRT